MKKSWDNAFSGGVRLVKKVPVVLKIAAVGVGASAVGLGVRRLLKKKNEQEAPVPPDHATKLNVAEAAGGFCEAELERIVQDEHEEWILALVGLRFGEARSAHRRKVQAQAELKVLRDSTQPQAPSPHEVKTQSTTKPSPEKKSAPVPPELQQAMEDRRLKALNEELRALTEPARHETDGAEADTGNNMEDNVPPSTSNTPVPSKFSNWVTRPMRELEFVDEAAKVLGQGWQQRAAKQLQKKQELQQQQKHQLREKLQNNEKKKQGKQQQQPHQQKETEQKVQQKKQEQQKQQLQQPQMQEQEKLEQQQQKQQQPLQQEQQEPEQREQQQEPQQPEGKAWVESVGMPAPIANGEAPAEAAGAAGGVVAAAEQQPAAQEQVSPAPR